MEQQKKLKRYKTTLCHNFEKTGTCQMGEKCHFAHGEQELRRINDPIPLHAISLYAKPMGYANDYGEQKGSTAIPPGYVKNNYKTVYCKFYMQDGHWSFGERCTYAHGEADLKPAIIPANMAGQDSNTGQIGMGGSGQDYQMDENGDNVGRYGVQDNHMYTMIQDNQPQEAKGEVNMQLLDDSIDTRRTIYEIVKLLKAQNYEEAKKLVTTLHGNIQITFSEDLCEAFAKILSIY